MIIIDWEFSGLDYKKHSLLSLWALDFRSPENQFYWECRIRDWALYDEEALEVNWFSVQDINDPSKKKLAELINDFDTWLKKTTKPHMFIWHNPKSDIDFLESSYELSNIEYSLGHRSIDTHSVVIMKHFELGMEIPVEDDRYKINLDKSLEFVWIKGWEPKPHNALMWAKCEAEVLNRIMHGKCLLDEFKKFPIPEYLLKNI